MRKNLSIAFFIASTIAGCTTVAPPKTASGRPEVTVSRADSARMKGLLISQMADRGYRIIKDEPYNIVFEKPSEDFGVNVLLSTPMGGNPTVRVAYAIAEIGGATRVIADIAYVSNAGMAFEQRLDVSRGNGSAIIQQVLDIVATDAQAAGGKTAAKN